jgi:hypothetical protein
MPDRPLLDHSDGDEVLAALRAVDEGSLYFSPGGLGGPLAPAHAAHVFATWMARLKLADDVPEDIRRNFDRVRKLFLYGLLERDLFAIADHEAHLVLEGALRHRFVTYYARQIPIWRNGQAETIAVGSFNDLHKLRSSLRRCQLRVANDREPLPYGYLALYTWARRRQLLQGQRNVGLFASLVNLRNYAAHPELYSDDLPPSVVRLLLDVAEIINKLWGHDTDGGRLFPGPVHRHPRCAALSPDSSAAVTFGSLTGVQTERKARDWTFAVFLAAEREELVDFDLDGPGQRFKYEPGFQLTDYPVKRLVGPGHIEDVLRFLAETDVDSMSDVVDFQDRLFFVRRRDGNPRPDFPRAPEDLTVFTEDDDEALWYLIRADFSMDAWLRIRDRQPIEPAEARGTEIVAELVGDEAARAYAASLLAS